MAEHGTKARYSKHIRDKDDPCQLCKDANAQYTRDLLANNPLAYRKELLQKRAVQRALTRLRNTFYVEYRQFYKEELQWEEDKLVLSEILELQPMDTATPTPSKDGD